MAKPAARILLLQGLLASAALVIVGRSVQVQLFQYSTWHSRAEQRRTTRVLPAHRGTIYDRNGVVLASSEQQYRISITLREVRDTAGLLKELPGLLGLPAEKVRKAFEEEYPYFNGPFSAEQIEPIRGIRGVHLEVIYRRVYPKDSTGAAVIGSMNESGTAGIGGLESSLDSLLRGTPGEERAWRAGRLVLHSPGTVVRDPVPGKAVYLTIDRELQNIAESELMQTIQEHHADGGDFVITEVETGEILAAASYRLEPTSGKMLRSASAFVEAYEPGSTAKLFTAAAILKAHSDTTPVSGECGSWQQKVSGNFVRTIKDVHKACEMLGLGDAIKFSSNIAMSKFSLRLDDSVQFLTLRDFGFGTSLGLNFPKETGGLVYRPADAGNPLLFKPSLAMGYFFGATTTHLTAAYAAIGNRGFLLAPSIVKEIRNADDSVLYRHKPMVLRRAVSDSIAEHLMSYLREVTEAGGTGLKAQLDDSSVAGKTGTAVLNYGKKGEPRTYRVSFAGVQPSDHPKIAFMAMIVRPRTENPYGGTVAAPLIRRALQAAIALLTSPIDRKQPPMVAAPAARPADASVDQPDRVVGFPLTATPTRDTGFTPIPELAGSTVRDATFALHQLGFEVKLLGRGRVRLTVPAAGDSLPRGSTVTIRADSLP
jgi:cell division protein FtsI (penicillin-binding protein 3)